MVLNFTCFLITISFLKRTDEILKLFNLFERHLKYTVESEGILLLKIWRKTIYYGAKFRNCWKCKVSKYARKKDSPDKN